MSNETACCLTTVFRGTGLCTFSVKKGPTSQDLIRNTPQFRNKRPSLRCLSTAWANKNSFSLTVNQKESRKKASDNFISEQLELYSVGKRGRRENKLMSFFFPPSYNCLFCIGKITEVWNRKRH